MSQLVIGAALGFLLGQGVLHCAKRLFNWLQREEVRERIRELSPSRGSGLINGFIKYAGVFGAVAALITLGGWTLGDYLAARSVRSVPSIDVAVPTVAVPVSVPQGSADGAMSPSPSPKTNSPAAIPVENVDPYADPDFRIQRRPRRPGSSQSLKETLLQRSEAAARADLLKDLREHAHRSQYDCEAAERASKYLKAGLDVWGFASWQLKYFPTHGYKGATLQQCKDIQNVVDPSGLDLQSTVADENHT
jgi:hypothetical protein